MIKMKNLDPVVQGLIRGAQQDPWGGIGEQFWVCNPSINAYARLDGVIPSERLHPTIMDAMKSCTADQGDLIKVAPGHTETITGAGGLAFNKGGVSVQGYGLYDLMPTVLMDGANTVTALFTEANVSVDNLKFHPGHADIAHWGHISAKGVRLSNCRWEENTTDENWVDIIHAGTADNDYDGLQLIGNEIHLTDAAHVTAIDLLKNCNDVQIIGNRITGDFDATPYAPIYMAVGEVAKNIQVFHNLIHNLHDDNAIAAISLACTTATGWMMYNHCYTLDVAGQTPFLTGATGIYCSQNYTAYAATDGGFEYPAIGTVA